MSPLVPAPAWNDERDALLLDLFAQPINQAEIAVRLSKLGRPITEDGVKARLQMLGLRRDPEVKKALGKLVSAARSSILDGWSEERVELLRALVAEGLSASQIAKRLGITRNSAIGKASRMGFRLTSEAAKEARRLTQVHKAAKRVKAPPPPKSIHIKPAKPMPSQPHVSGGKTLFDLERHECRWPLGSFDEPGSPETLFCGRAVRFREGDATSWCPTHSARVFVKTERKPQTTPAFDVRYVQPHPVVTRRRDAA